MIAKENSKKLSVPRMVMLAIALVWSSGCHNTIAPTPAAPVPAPAVTQSRPIINYFKAEPSTVSGGQSSLLHWSVEHATSVEIDQGIGTVNANDRQPISPQHTTSYLLRASNAAGTAEGTVTVSVSTPPTVSGAEQDAARLSVVNRQLRDIHFAYNEGTLRPEDRETLEQDATLLSDLFRLDVNSSVMVEGHCDERGSAEYNIGLGDRRAMAVKEAFVKLGVPQDRLKTVSFGKEHLLCEDETDQCHAENRRVHLSVVRDVSVSDLRQVR